MVLISSTVVRLEITDQLQVGCFFFDEERQNKSIRQAKKKGQRFHYSYDGIGRRWENKKVYPPMQKGFFFFLFFSSVFFFLSFLLS